MSTMNMKTKTGIFEKNSLKKFLAIALGVFVLTLFIGVLANQEAEAATSTLTWGSQGQAVKDVQQRLKNWGYYTGTVDGVYGRDTYSAILKFQKKNNLTADGVVGNKTYEALGLTKYMSTKSSGAVSTSDDAYLLARAIWAESEAEPYIGKVAVGAVLLNRVDSSSFPNTLSGVIYQSYALESVSNSRINNAGPDSDSLRAAHDALNGWDPSYGCLYFWNPATATSPWIWSRTVVVRYGNHVFGK